jgi:hypothetical protein
MQMIDIGSPAKRTPPDFGEQYASPSSRTEAHPTLEVNVVFTTYRSTLAALKTAGNLVRHLDARIRLLVAQVVPFALPLDCPPVSVPFTQERCRSLASECAEASEVQINLYLCRDKRQVLRQVLRPRSLIVVGGSRRWWSTPEEKLATMLRNDGHRVIFADLSCLFSPVAGQKRTS